MDRNRVPKQVITLDPKEVDTGSSEEEDNTSTTSEDTSTDQDTPTKSSIRSPLADIEHYELIKEAYCNVGYKYQVSQDRLEGGFDTLKPLEEVPRRWPLARLTFPLRKTIEYLDRLLAGCYWETLISRPDPQNSLASQVSQNLTLALLLAGCPAFSWLSGREGVCNFERGDHSPNPALV